MKGKFRQDYKGADPETIAKAQRAGKAKNPGRSSTGGGVLRREAPPGCYKFSDYPCVNLCFNTPVGAFWDLQSAIEACRKAGIKGIGTEDSPITQSWEKTGPSLTRKTR